MKTQHIIYYVEGEDEEKLVNTLKSDLFLIKSGKVQRLNVIEQKISRARLINMRANTIVVLVFDTDTGNTDILNENIKVLKACSTVLQIITIPQVLNLEDELVRSCAIRRIKDLLGSRSNGDFKKDLIKVTNLSAKLQKNNFDINEFWSSTPNAPYQCVENMAHIIKIGQ